MTSWLTPRPSCLVIFFSALAGIGYVDPEATPTAAAEFIPGSPVFDSRVDQVEVERNRMLEEHRALEQMWQRKKRPKDVSSNLGFFFLYPRFAYFAKQDLEMGWKVELMLSFRALG